MIRFPYLIAFAVIGLASLAAAQETQPSLREELPLKEAAGERFLIGFAAMSYQLNDPQIAALVTRHFNTLTPENEMKPQSVHPAPGEWNWEAADQLVEFAEQNDMKLIGHTLVWHQQSPRFLFEDEDGKPLSREVALANMKEHIQTVVGRYKGRVHGWDVVNEAIDDGGPYLRDTPALRAIGEDYIVKAFEFAREADPDAELYYNDYNIERDYKGEKAARLLQSLIDAGQAPDAVGIQGHWLVGSPDLAEIERGITRFTDLGLRVDFTEVDVDPLPRRGAGADLNEQQGDRANPYVDGLTEKASAQLAERYRELFGLLLKHEQHIGRVTFWGIHDGTSWLNGFPVRGRTNHPLLFDRDLQPKPAFDAVVEVMQAE